MMWYTCGAAIATLGFGGEKGEGGEEQNHQQAVTIFMYM